MSQKLVMKCIQWMLIAVVSLMIGGSAGFVTTVHAAEPTTNTVQEVSAGDADTTESESDDASGSGFFLLAGGLLIIILTVVISVVSTFVSTAAIVDEL